MSYGKMMVLLKISEASLQHSGVFVSQSSIASEIDMFIGILTSTIFRMLQAKKEVRDKGFDGDSTRLSISVKVEISNNSSISIDQGPVVES